MRGIFYTLSSISRCLTRYFEHGHDILGITFWYFNIFYIDCLLSSEVIMGWRANVCYHLSTHCRGVEIDHENIIPDHEKYHPRYIFSPLDQRRKRSVKYRWFNQQMDEEREREREKEKLQDAIFSKFHFSIFFLQPTVFDWLWIALQDLI